MSHSPHPWRLDAGSSPARIESSTGGPALALVYLTNPQTRRRAPTFETNARLMCLAPDLLDMVQRLRDVILSNTGEGDPVPYCVQDANALIAKILP